MGYATPNNQHRLSAWAITHDENGQPLMDAIVLEIIATLIARVDELSTREMI
jgi:hypothetical protein